MEREEALERVGEGWSDLVCRFYSFLDVITRGCHCIYPTAEAPYVDVVEANLGMLRIVAHHSVPIVQEMLDKLANTIERDSVRICEVCGGKGYRRKALPGLPNRCRTHYIELTNKMAESGAIIV